jgi:hypothetical protein
MQNYTKQGTVNILNNTEGTNAWGQPLLWHLSLETCFLSDGQTPLASYKSQTCIYKFWEFLHNYHLSQPE